MDNLHIVGRSFCIFLRLFSMVLVRFGLHTGSPHFNHRTAYRQTTLDAVAGEDQRAFQGNTVECLNQGVDRLLARLGAGVTSGPRAIRAADGQDATVQGVDPVER